MAYFAVALLLSLFDSHRFRRLLLIVSLAGALAGASFIFIQLLVLRALCPYCMIVDVTAMLLFASAWWTRRSESITSGWTRVGFGCLCAAIVTATFFIPRTWALPSPVDWAAKPGGPPEFVLREQRPGVATIVMFTDLECSYCRDFRPTLQPMKGRYGDRLRIVVRHHPLTFHKNARTAAIAAICAEELGKGGCGDRSALHRAARGAHGRRSTENHPGA